MRSARVQDQRMPGVEALEVTTPELAVAIGFGKKMDPSDAL